MRQQFMRHQTAERRFDTAARAGGFTLIEVAIAAGLLALVIGGAMNLWIQSQLAFAEQVRQNVVDDTGQRVLGRLTEEVIAVRPQTIQPILMNDSESMQFRKVEGYDRGAPVLGPLTTLAFELENGETGNGRDDNGDGRIDEGYVTYTEGSQNTVRIAGNITGLRFNSLPSGISVSVDVAIVRRGGDLVEETFTAVVTFRNSD